ncbi:hypothetical protein POM88_024741 [Heracleum sosnowskyi]|uniref:Uncharacterized protein n=1 Tax=Heracleum sosnowskyi TaxID=360622 RepID=A0AAD8I4S2_9APIA|nr:hypothetical protein POM88_024741 [Heracleum sosnowskyi]
MTNKTRDVDFIMIDVDELSFIYDLPTRLGKCLKSEAYADAVKLYTGAMPIFEAYGDSSFKDCKRASEQEVSKIIKILQDKYIVPDDAKPWVNKSMSDHFRSYKSRIKRDYYNTYPTDEERLSHRPEEVSLSDWKILLNYWGDEKVQEIAKKNSEARQKITETHTTGSTSFAQVAHMLRLEKLAKLEKEKQEKLGKMPVNDDGEGEGNGEEEVNVFNIFRYILHSSSRPVGVGANC